MVTPTEERKLAAGARAPQRDGGLPGLRTDTLLTNLQNDPRWNAFLQRWAWPTTN